MAGVRLGGELVGIGAWHKKDEAWSGDVLEWSNTGGVGKGVFRGCERQQARQAPGRQFGQCRAGALGCVF